ncbi:phage baseplate assembly protein V [Desulfitobacterium hafniense]|uniref:phage baseplate assembly protein V n=1 Tax=Desulfitobacterium hafniense TaxID=49338 RepID=UPI00037B4B8B|nr:phage baseplate assembly protein V [Desulfitobacterium hafniense]
MSIFEQFMPSQGQSQDTMSGVILAKVTNINDPEKLGRVKCQFITKNKEALELDWAHVMTPFGGKECGFYFIPNVEDTVLVAFENGDIYRPYIIGSLWGNLAKPPAAVNEGKNETYMIKTPNKSTLEFSDAQGKESLSLMTPKERKIVLNDEKKTIEITDGQNTLSMNENGEVKLTCKQKLVIEVGSGAKITIDGMAGSIKIEGKQAINLESAQVEVKATANATIKANAQVSIESSGMTMVKGSMLKLN